MLIKPADLILNKMEADQISAIVLMDPSAAFDTVNHTILLETFEKIWNYRGCSHGSNPACLEGCFVLLSTRNLVKKATILISTSRWFQFSFFIMYAATLFHVILDEITLFGFANDQKLQGLS